MVSLKDWMRREGVSDTEMADRIGRVSAVQVRKLRFRERGPSIQVAARIEAITAGEVRCVDMLPTSPRRAPALAETPR